MHQKSLQPSQFFLARELKPLIFWPIPEQILPCKHPHFSGDFNKVEGIGDCTEQ